LILDNLWCAFEGDKKTLYSHASKCSCIWAINIFELDEQTFAITVASDGCGEYYLRSSIVKAKDLVDLKT